MRAMGTCIRRRVDFCINKCAHAGYWQKFLDCILVHTHLCSGKYPDSILPIAGADLVHGLIKGTLSLKVYVNPTTNFIYFSLDVVAE